MKSEITEHDPEMVKRVARAIHTFRYSTKELQARKAIEAMRERPPVDLMPVYRTSLLDENGMVKR